MQNNFQNAEYLALAGYSETDIEKYFRLLDRKCVRGLNSLTVNERRFYNKAQTNMRLVWKRLEAETVAAQKRSITGKQPVETKLHYRWVEADLATINRVVEKLPGEVSAFAIIKEETLAALRKYQPVLNQVDTSKRFKFVPVERELLALAAAFGRVANFDIELYLDILKTEFAEFWQDSWSLNTETSDHQHGAVISLLDEAEYRAEVRVQIEALTREVYPSVTVTV
jgi:hypothetical protein